MNLIITENNFWKRKKRGVTSAMAICGLVEHGRDARACARVRGRAGWTREDTADHLGGAALLNGRRSDGDGKVWRRRTEARDAGTNQGERERGKGSRRTIGSPGASWGGRLGLGWSESTTRARRSSAACGEDGVDADDSKHSGLVPLTGK
jgi:hypothetical protein